MEETTFRLTDGYSRLKNPPSALYRYMRPDEARALCAGDHVTFRAKDGKSARTAKINGTPRTWKREPDRLEVPLKYGMYEFATMVARGGIVQEWGGSGAALVVRVDEE